MRILAVTRKPDSPSYEQRVLRYVEPLREHRLEVEQRILPQSTLAQWKFLSELADYDLVWWHRHLPSPWLVRRLRRFARKLVFDFDDPLWYSSKGGGKPSVMRRLRFAGMLRRCDAALTASHYLDVMARRYAPRSYILPMAIDLPPEIPRPTTGDPVELLWLGSRSTQPYLRLIQTALETVGRRHKDRVRLRLVAHEPASFEELTVDFHPWSPSEQDAALRECHIGLCPMPDTLWTKGKCPYKVLQYMAYAMPWVGSAVGENMTVASEDGVPRGFCAASTDQWVDRLNRLIEQPALRQRMGAAGRVYVEQEHNRTTLVNRLVSVLQDIGRS